MTQVIERRAGVISPEEAALDNFLDKRNLLAKDGESNTPVEALIDIAKEKLLDGPLPELDEKQRQLLAPIDTINPERGLATHRTRMKTREGTSEIYRDLLHEARGIFTTLQQSQGGRDSQTATALFVINKIQNLRTPLPVLLRM